MRCICLHSPPQPFSNRISPSAACFLFIARNRKTRFPAFSIPNGLVLWGKTSLQNPPQGDIEGKRNKSWSILSPNIPLAGSQVPCPFSGLISCRLGGKDRTMKLPAQDPRICAAAITVCWAPVMASQKENPATVGQVTEFGKSQWKGAWLRTQEF